MYLYRIEAEDGQGPFTTEAALQINSDTHPDLYDIPAPFQDPARSDRDVWPSHDSYMRTWYLEKRGAHAPIGIHSYEVCAMPTLSSLQDWARPDRLKELQFHGYLIHRYSVPRVHLRLGVHQAVFPKALATGHSLQRGRGWVPFSVDAASALRRENETSPEARAFLSDLFSEPKWINGAWRTWQPGYGWVDSWKPVSQ